jgi:L-ascorbate metabolism protein UlaG (beta-lactamase superfamily)
MFQKDIFNQIHVNIHSSVCIRGEKIIYIDPVKIPDAPHDADLILITHSHFDHFSPKDIKKLLKDDTVIAAPKSIAKIVKLRTGREPVSVQPAQTLTLSGVPVETVAAYNKSKPAHMRSLGWVGYVLTVGETRLYITGDTDVTAESSAVQCDILMLPVSGGMYTMTAKEAAELTNQLKPHTVIPIHYGVLLGGKNAPETFRAGVAAGIETDIRDTVYNNLMVWQLLRIFLLALGCGILGYFVGQFI